MRHYNQPLTSDDYTALRSGRWAGAQRLSVCPNNVVLAGRVNSDLFTQSSWAEFNYNMVTEGSYTDVLPDQLLLISSAGNDISKATFRGRVRDDPTFGPATATTLYCNESSQDFAAGGAYFWVIDDYDITDRLSRPVGTPPVQQKDFNQPYRKLAPCILGLQTGYEGDCDSGTGKLRLAFDLSASIPMEYGATLGSGDFEFLFPTGCATLISGSLTSWICTVDIAPGWWWGRVRATDDQGTVWERRFAIQATDDDHLPTAEFKGGSWNNTLEQGWTATVAAFAGIDNILDGTFCILSLCDEVNSPDIGNNIDMIGWWKHESNQVSTDPLTGMTSESTWEIVGAAGVMSRIEGQLLDMELDATPTIYDHINQLTQARAIWNFITRHSTVANMCDVEFDITDLTYLFPTWTTQEGVLLQNINGIAKQVTAALEFWPDGPITCARQYGYLDPTERNALPEIATWTNTDLRGTGTASRDHDQTVGKVDANGAGYSGTAILKSESRAPGSAQGSADGTATLPNQVAVAGTVQSAVDAEIAQRAGSHLEVSNPTETFVANHPGGYHKFIASMNQWYKLDIDITPDGEPLVNRIRYTTAIRWTVFAVNYVHDNEKGTRTVQVTYRKETAFGDPGLTLQPIAPGTLVNPIPPTEGPAFPWEPPIDEVGVEAINPIDLIPIPGLIAPFNGNYVAAKSPTRSFGLQNFINLKKPRPTEVTPLTLGAYVIQQILLDPFSGKNNIGCYILASDGTNSAVWHSDNIGSAKPVWTKGNDQVGVYTIICTTKIRGSVLIWGALTGGSSGSIVTQTLSYAYNTTGPASVLTGNPFTVYSGAVGTYGGVFNSGTYARLRFTASPGVAGNMEALSVIGYQFGPIITGNEGIASGINGFGIGFQSTFTDFSLIVPKVFHDGNGNVGCEVRSGTPFYLTFVYDPQPITLTDSAVAFSPDYGANFFVPASSGLSPGTLGGFDVQKSGLVSYSAAAGILAKSSSLSGGYSAWYSVPSSANPVCVVIPYYKRNSITLNTTMANPDVIIATDNGKLYWIDGVTATATNITPTGVTAFDNAHCVTVLYGTHIACFGKVSGVYHVFTSINGGTTWTDRGAVSNPSFIRCRRNDGSAVNGGNHGQLYLAADDVIYYSNTWLNGGFWPRTMPVTGIDGLDIRG